MGRRRPRMNSLIPLTPSAQTTEPSQRYKQKKQRGRVPEPTRRQRRRGNPERQVVVSPLGRGVTALMYACQQGDVDKVRRILRTQVIFIF